MKSGLVREAAEEDEEHTPVLQVISSRNSHRMKQSITKVETAWTKAITDTEVQIRMERKTVENNNFSAWLLSKLEGSNEVG